jgi:hypothetical protein
MTPGETGEHMSAALGSQECQASPVEPEVESTHPLLSPWNLTPTPLGVPGGDDGSRPWFWLGVHNITFLRRTDVPLFLSRRRFTKQRPQSWPEAQGPWACDSGGFTELSQHSGWTLGAREYVEFLREVNERVGNLAWAAPQDWMCEPEMIAKVATAGTAAAALGRSTSRGVTDHLILTVRNFLELRELLDRPDDPHVIPVVQGWSIDDYEMCLQMYDAAGVDLSAESLVGVGSVCRRDADLSILAKLAWLGEAGLHRLHGFGVKGSALPISSHRLASADSMAWSYGARRAGRPIIEGHTHAHCGNCLEAALAWRDRMTRRCNENTHHLREGLAIITRGLQEGTWPPPDPEVVLDSDV